MNKLIKFASGVAVCAAALGASLSNAQAQTFTMTFEGMSNAAQIRNWYDGGQDSLPQNGTGPNYGVTFGFNPSGLGGPNAQSTTGKFENAPPAPGTGQRAGTGVLYAPFDASSVLATDSMNVAGGFSALSFYYSTFSSPGSVSIYSGVNGTGTLLQTINLSVNSIIGSSAGTSCTNRSDEFCNWSLVTAALNGQVGRSLVFNNSDLETSFDNITITVPVPEPETYALMLAGLGVLGFIARSRKRQA